MDTHQILLDIAALGPALGAVVCIGVVCFFLVKLLNRVLGMLENHGDALKIISQNMQAHTDVLKEVDRNVQVNTRVTEHMSTLLRNHVDFTKFDNQNNKHV